VSEVTKTTAEKAQARQATEYFPEIEARRADYEKLADCLLHMGTLESSRCPSLLDIEGPLEIHGPHLVHGINSHLAALFYALDWYDERTLRKFYVEMRLHLDQHSAQLEREKPKEDL